MNWVVDTEDINTSITRFFFSSVTEVTRMLAGMIMHIYSNNVIKVGMSSTIQLSSAALSSAGFSEVTRTSKGFESSPASFCVAQQIRH